MAVSGTSAYGAAINSSLTGSGTGSAAATSTVASTTAAMKRAVQSGSSPDVIVSLSSSALAALQARTRMQTADYAASFPTRAGFDVTALAAAVGEPGAASSSAGKSFAALAVDARARMDAKYAAMEAAGQAFDPDSAEGRDGHALMGDLDRRSLYAVSSNEGGLFSAQEQAQARAIMNRQLSLAMGLSAGATLQGGAADPFAGNTSARFDAAAAFLADVSAEEKQSAAWLQQSALVSAVTSAAGIGTLAQPTNIFGIMAEMDKQQGGADVLFGSDTSTYSQLAGAAQKLMGR